MFKNDPSQVRRKPGRNDDGDVKVTAQGIHGIEFFIADGAVSHAGVNGSAGKTLVLHGMLEGPITGHPFVRVIAVVADEHIRISAHGTQRRGVGVASSDSGLDVPARNNGIGYAEALEFIHASF